MTADPENPPLLVNHEIARKTRLAAAAVLAAGFGTSVEAAHPLLTEDTGTQGDGNYQLELMLDKTRDNPPGVTVRELQTAAVLSYGLLENADLQVGLPVLRQHTHDAGGRHARKGPLDASLDLKWRFYEREALSLAFKPGITLPTGDAGRGFGAGRAAAHGASGAQRWPAACAPREAGFGDGAAGTAPSCIFPARSPGRRRSDSNWSPTSAPIPTRTERIAAQSATGCWDSSIRRHRRSISMPA